MIELFQNYAIKDIIIFIVILAIAIKESISFITWAVSGLRKFFKKETDEETREKELEEKIEEDRQSINKLNESQERMQNSIDAIMQKIDTLVNSDKDDIKSFIVKEHHHFCYDKGWIDDYSMDCIEKRFKHYQDEGGNSYVEELMKDLRSLEHRPPQ